MLTVVRYMGGAVAYAPSQVLHVIPKRDGGEMREVYVDAGDHLSAASVAAVRGKRLLIGAIADTKFLERPLLVLRAAPVVAEPVAGVEVRVGWQAARVERIAAHRPRA